MITLERTAQLWGITGNLGGGKSLSAVHFAVNAMRDGYYVVSNITLKIDEICRAYGGYMRELYQRVDVEDPAFDPFKLPCGSPRGSGGNKRVLIILDECAEWFDQYTSAKDPKIQRIWSWIRHTSKRSQDVFIIVQRPDYLNKVIRILISRWIWVNDLAVWRVPVLKLRVPFMGGYVLRNIYDKLGNRIGSPSCIRKAYWGRFYDTAECLNSDGAQYNVEYRRPPRPDRRPAILAALYLASLYALVRAVYVRVADEVPPEFAPALPPPAPARVPGARRAPAGLVYYNNIVNASAAKEAE